MRESSRFLRLVVSLGGNNYNEGLFHATNTPKNMAITVPDTGISHNSLLKLTASVSLSPQFPPLPNPKYSKHVI